MTDSQDLSLASLLGLLRDDPENETHGQAVVAFAKRGGDLERDRAIRLLEVARAGHEERKEYYANSLLLEAEAHLVREERELSAALLRELGRLRQEKLLDDEGALAAYRLSLELEDHEESRAHVELLQERKTTWKSQAEERIEAARGSATEERAWGAAQLADAASLLTQYGGDEDRKAADELFAEALAADPSSAAIARQYALSLRRQERWQELCDAHMSAAGRLHDAKEREVRYARAARLLSGPLADPQQAAAAYEKVVIMNPTHPGALAYLVPYYTEREEYDELVRIYEGVLSVAKGTEEEAPTLLQIAMVHWRLRERPEDARSYFRRLRNLNPTQPAMVSYFREHGSASTLHAVLAQAQDQVEDQGERLRLALEIAEGAELAQHPANRRIEAWREVRGLDPSSPRAKDQLRRLYEETSQWNALVGLLDEEFADLPRDAREERLGVLQQLVAIYREKLRLTAMVTQTYHRMLELDPTHGEALDGLARVYESMGRTQELVDVLTKKAASLTETEPRIDHYMRVADLWMNKLANYGRAVGPLESVLSLDPQHSQAFELLKGIFVRKREWGKLDELLAGQGSAEGDHALEFSIERAQLAESKLRDPALAMRRWREVLHLEPNSGQALSALERLAADRRDWPALVEVLEQRLERTEDVAARVQLLSRLGSIYSDTLNDQEKATRSFETLLELQPEHGRALRALRSQYFATRNWESLRRVYSQANEWAQLAETLGDAADIEQSDDVRIKLSLEAAAILEGQLGDSYRAFRHYERVLSVEPDNRQAAQALVPIYRRDENWASVAAMREILAGHASEEERPDLYVALSETYGDRLRNAEASLDWAAKAYRLAPQRPSVLRALEKAARGDSGREALIRLFEERLEQASSEESLELHRKLADLYEHDAASMAKHLERLLAEGPEDQADLLARLEDTYRRLGQNRSLASILERRVANAESVAKIPLLAELADIQQSEGDVAASIATVRALRELCPGDEELDRKLVDLLRTSESWDDLAEFYSKRLEDSGSIEDRFRLIDLFRHHLGDEDAALSQLQRVLEDHPGHPQAREMLEVIARSSSSTALLADECLSKDYSRPGEEAALVSVLRRRLARVDEPATRREIVDALIELLTGRLSDWMAAYEVCEAEFLRELTPDEVRVAELERLAEAADALPRCCDVLEGLLEQGTLDDAAKAAIHIRLCETYDNKLSLTDQAARHHQAVFDFDPSDDRSFAWLRNLYEGERRWDDLLSLCRRRLPHLTSTDETVDLLGLCGRVNEEHLEHFDDAIEDFEKVLLLVPDHERAKSSLRSLFMGTQEYQKLSTLLLADAESQSGRAAAELYHELGLLHSKELGSSERGVEFYRRALEALPTHMRSQQALEDLLTDESVRRDVARILEDLYEAQGAWEPLQDVLLIRLDNADSAESKLLCLMQLAELRESRLGDPLGAFEASAHALKIDPGHEDVRATLRRLAESHGLHDQLAEIFEQAAADVDDPEARLELLHEVATLFDGPCGKPEKAEKAFRLLLEEPTLREELRRQALRSLERVHRGTGDYAALEKVLSAQLALVADDDERKRILWDQAELYTQLMRDSERAEEAYRTILEISPDELGALRGLQQSYMARENYEGVVEIIHRELATGLSASDAYARTQVLATIYDERLDDRSRAVRALEDYHDRYGFSVQSLELVVDLYRRSSLWEKLVDSLQELGRLDQDARRKARWLFELSEALVEHSEDHFRALAVLQDVLRLDPDHAQALGCVEGLLEDCNGSVRLEAAKFLEGWFSEQMLPEKRLRALNVVAESDISVERAWALQEAATVAMQELQDPSRAFDCLLRAFVELLESDELEDIAARLERVGEQSGRLAEFVQAVEGSHEKILDVRARIWLLQRAALHAAMVPDRETAVRLHQIVRELEPANEASLEALCELVSPDEQPELYVELLEAKELGAQSPDERNSVRLRRSEILERPLGRRDKAIQILQDVVSDDGIELVFDKLETLLRLENRHHELVDLYELALDRGAQEAPKMHRSLGMLHQQHLEDNARALAHFRQLLVLDPMFGDAGELLSGLISDPECGEEALSLLEGFHARRMDWQGVCHVLDLRLAASEDAPERDALLRRKAQVLEETLEDLPRAMRAYADLYVEEPRDEEVRRHFVRLARNLGEDDEIIRVYERVLDDGRLSDGESMPLFHEVATLLCRAKAPLRAAPHYEKVIAVDPYFKDAFENLRQIYIEHERHAELQSLYEKRLDVVDSDVERIDLFVRLARLAEGRADASAAIGLYRDVLTLDSENPDAHEALPELLRSESRYDELAVLLRDRVETAADPEVANAYRRQLADLLVVHLSDVPRAIDVYEDIFRVVPGDAEAIASVRGLLESAEDKSRLRDLLETQYRETGRWRDVVDLVLARGDGESSREVRSEVLVEVARIYEECLSEPSRALEYIGRALCETPGDERLLDEIERVGSATQQWASAVRFVETAVTSASSFEQEVLLRKLGALYEARVGDFRASAQAYERLRALRPDDDGLLISLEQMYTMLGDWDGLERVYEAKLDREGSPTVRSELWRRIARIRGEERSDPSGAVRAFESALGEDEFDLDALRALDGIYAASSQWSDLARVLEMQRRALPDDPSRLAVVLRLGELYSGSLAKPADALEAYEEALSYNPDNQEAFDAIAALHMNARRFDVASDTWVRRAEVAESDESRAEALFRAGEILELQADDAGGALDRYREALQVLPGFEPALGAALRMGETTRYLEAVVDLVEPMLTDLGRWEDLVRLLRRAATNETRPSLRREMLQRVADLQGNQCDDAAGAFDTLCDAHRADPEDERGFEALRRAAGEQGMWNSFCMVVEEVTPLLSDEFRRQARYAELGSVYERELNDPTKAMIAYSQGLSIGEDPELLERLDRLLEAQGNWGELQSVLVRRLELESEPTLRATLGNRLGALRLSELGDVRGSFDAYRDVLDQFPDDQDALGALENLLANGSLQGEVSGVLESAYLARDELGKVAELCERRGRWVQDPGERATMFRRAAELWEVELDNPSRALGAYRETFLADPGDLSLPDRIEGLAERLQDYSWLANVVEEALNAQPGRLSGADRADLHMWAARLTLEKVHDHEGALHCARAAALADPGRTDCLRFVVARLRDFPGETDALVKALVELARAAGGDDAVQFYFEAATLAENELRDDSQARELYREAHREDPGHVESLDAVIRFARAEGKFEDLVELIERRVDLENDPDARLRLRRDVAQLVAERLRRPARAISAYEAIVDEVPDDLQALEALEGLYERAARWDDLRALLERRLDIETDPAEKVRLQMGLASLAEERFDDRVNAIDYLRSALEIKPNSKIYSEMERMLTQDEEWQELVDLLARRFETAQQQEEGEVAREVAERWARVAERAWGDSDELQRARNALAKVLPGS